MAAATASRPLTPLLHRHHPRSWRRASAVVVAAASTPEAEPTAAGSGQEKKKTVDTRIHWSDPDEGWIGGKAKKDGAGGVGGRSKNEPLGGRFADLINAASESHYQLSPYFLSRLLPSKLKLSES
jgi:hypothetical protein